MSNGDCDNGDERDDAVVASRGFMTLYPQSSNALCEWMDASKAWSSFLQFIEENGDSPTARRKLKKLERRLNAAADAFEQAQQQSD